MVVKNGYSKKLEYFLYKIKFYFFNLRQEAAHASVLIPLCFHQGVASVLLTRRPITLRNHPGQVSFPGNRFYQFKQILLFLTRRPITLRNHPGQVSFPGSIFYQLKQILLEVDFTSLSRFYQFKQILLVFSKFYQFQQILLVLVYFTSFSIFFYYYV